jgi:hypothetical protein
VFRLASIAVVFAMMSPSALIFLPTTSASEANLPACCRRDGKHHCAMMMNAQVASDQTQVESMPEACPFQGGAITVAHTPAAAVTAPMFFAEVVSHPSLHEQTLARLRIAESRSHQKRGPPVLS